MSELLISIAVNLALGVILLALLYRKRTRDPVRLTLASEAMDIFRMHVPDALGAATLAADGRAALIDLQRGGTGLVHVTAVAGMPACWRRANSPPFDGAMLMQSSSSLRTSGGRGSACALPMRTRARCG